MISEENYRDIVFPLPVGDLLFVGKRTAEELSRMGIRTIGSLASMSEAVLVMHFGKSGSMLHKYANGLDDSPVAHKDERTDSKSIGSGMTFRHNVVGREEWRIGINHLAEDVARRLRSAEQKCATVQLTVKDEYLRTLQRQRPIHPESDIAREIAEVALTILEDEWLPGRPIRALTVTATNLVRSQLVAEQIDMFSDGSEREGREKNKKREETVDTIRKKFGSSAIISGGIMNTDLGIYAPKDKKH